MVFGPGLSSPSEQLLVLDDADAQLQGVIVIHSTGLGPAAGGCRFWEYPSMDAASADALRLAVGMSYKNALADLPLGGGKAVLQRPSGPFDRKRFFAAFGRAVNSLGGRYVTAEDVGTLEADMQSVSAQTRHVAGLPRLAGRPGGDPSPWTARGVFLSMELAAMRRLHRPLNECTVAVQGLGNVGYALAQMLHKAGARLVVADLDSHHVSRTVATTGAKAVSSDEIMSVAADVFAPCALGGVFSDSTIGSLKAKVVCGAANNQLATSEDGLRLADHGVLYAPDYVVNAGGIINVAAEYLGWTSRDALARVEDTARRVARVLDFASSEGLSTDVAADGLAQGIIAGGARRLSMVA